MVYVETLGNPVVSISLGHDQSLMIYIPTDFFFEDMVVFTDVQKEKYRELMGEGFFRLSVGIENAADIIDDLRQALTIFS